MFRTAFQKSFVCCHSRLVCVKYCSTWYYIKTRHGQGDCFVLPPAAAPWVQRICLAHFVPLWKMIVLHPRNELLLKTPSCVTLPLNFVSVSASTKTHKIQKDLKSRYRAWRIFRIFNRKKFPKAPVAIVQSWLMKRLQKMANEFKTIFCCGHTV